MPARSVAIHSKSMLLPEGIREATLFIDDGQITGVVPGLAMAAGLDLVDVGGNLVMPGLIDPHVHINEPGRTDWEGFDTATRSAVAGGFTLLVDMPLNSSPVTTTATAFDQKMTAATGRLHCDCGYWGGVVPGNEKEIEPLIARGVLGFKAFLTDSGIDEFQKVAEIQLRKVMPILAAHGLPLLVHCELDSPAAPSAANSPANPGGPCDPRSYRQYLASRPHQWEDAAIALMIRLCAETRCPVHIVHLSSAASIAPIREAKEKGLPLTVETAPHYLYFAAETIPDGNPLFKCAPPIRDRANNHQLWEALREGVIDFIATDHSPAPPELKHLTTGNLPAAWGGIASLQLSLPVVWTAARERGFSPKDIACWLSAAPARLTHQSACRGKLAPGYRADLTIWNPDTSFTVDPSTLQHKHKATPYSGETLFGTIEHTWLHGEQVFDKGVFSPVQGKIIRQTPATIQP
ncbi:allantoinase AllB [Puia sp.]|uniref:allantoinase AllB n=1 Tax=Puia sp. TaxID=2045100 RepID=UPI002F41785E